MTEDTCARIIRVLIIDDDKEMTANLCDAFERYSKGKIILPEEMRHGRQWEFLPECVFLPERMSEPLRARPTWDIIVIDKMFDGEPLSIEVLKSLRDLQVDAIRIVWTAYPEERDIIDSMRLGAWDYLDKKAPRHGDTFTDVIVSAIEGLQEKESQLRKAKIDREGHEFVVDHYGEIYPNHKGNFVAFGRDEQGNWNIEPLAKDPSLFGLYRKLGDINHEEIHITLINE